MKRFYAAAGYITLLGALFVTLATNVYIYKTQNELVLSEDKTRTSALSWTASQLDRSGILLRMLIMQRQHDSKLVSDVELRKAFDIFVSRVDEATPLNTEYASLKNSRIQDNEFFEELQETTYRFAKLIDQDKEIKNDVLFALATELQHFSPDFRRITQESYSKNNVIFDQRRDFLINEIRYGLYASVSAGVLAFLVVVTTLLVFRQYRNSLELKQIAKQSAEEKDLADAANKAKTAFLANISHELPTPVHGIMGMMDLLANTDLKISQRNYVDNTYKATNHLMSLLSDLIDSAKGDSGKIRIFARPIKLQDLINDVEVIMMTQAISKDLDFSIDRGPNLPSVVYADAKRLRQIFLNLIGNAIKFTNQGHVTVVIRSQPEVDTNNIVLLFEVTDSGPGMDECTQKKIFDRFYQGNSSRSRKHGGAGLGLEISKNLVELMNGEITVKSALGEGSTFYVSIPLAVGSNADLEPGIHQKYDISNFAGKNVLVAEDDEMSRIYMAGLLVQMNINSTFCTNGEEVVHQAKSKIFDLIIMDLHMPKLDGFKATKMIRENGLNQNTPIVALTADAFEETRDKCIQSGMSNFMKKPLDKNALIETLNNLPR